MSVCDCCVCPPWQCELYHWIEVLDRFDGILEEATRHELEVDPTGCIFMCPKLEDHVVRAADGYVRFKPRALSYGVVKTCYTYIFKPFQCC